MMSCDKCCIIMCPALFFININPLYLDNQPGKTSVLECIFHEGGEFILLSVFSLPDLQNELKYLLNK